MFHEKLIQHGLVQLHTESFGNPNVPAILLISGSMCPGRFWIDEFCESLSKQGYFVIRYDNRDTGESSGFACGESSYTLDDMAADAIAILDAYSVSKAHIIGGSMGGLIAQIIALDYPHRVLSIIPMATAVFGGAENFFTPQEAAFLYTKAKPMIENRPTREFEASLHNFVRAWESLHGDIPVDPDIVTAYVKDMYTRTRKEHYAWFDRLSAGIEPAHNHEYALHAYKDRTTELKTIKVPVLAIHGELDCLIPLRIMQEQFLRYLPDASHLYIPKMGHIVFSHELFAYIGEQIISFLNTVQPLP